MAVLDEFAKFIVKSEFSRLADEAVAEAKLSLLDTIGAILVGEGSELYGLVGNIIAPDIPQEATTFPTGNRTDALSALQINCSVAHCSEIDNIHPDSIVCIGGMVVPAALAWVEKKGGSGKDLLTAIVLGSEVGIRIGASVKGADLLPKGWWPSALFGPLGVCAAVAKLETLTEDQTRHALSICSTLCGGLINGGAEGATARHFLYGWSARCGAASVLAAKSGFTGPENALEISQGLFSARDAIPDFSTCTEDLGEKFRLYETVYKNYASAMQSQSAVCAFLRIVNEQGLKADMVEQVTVELPKKALVVVKGGGIPDNHTTAAAHGGYLVAAAITSGDILPRQFAEDRIFDPEIREFAGRVEVRENKELEKGRYDGKWPARVIIKLKSGKTFEMETIDWMDGGSRKDFVEKKFARLLSAARQAERIDIVMKAVETIDQEESVEELIKNAFSKKGAAI